MPSQPAASPSTQRHRWMVAAVLILFGVTVGSLTMAWLRPEQTRLHFWLVAQCVPLFYWLLIWGFDRWAPEDDDVL